MRNESRESRRGSSSEQSCHASSPAAPCRQPELLLSAAASQRHRHAAAASHAAAATRLPRLPPHACRVFYYAFSCLFAAAVTAGCVTLRCFSRRRRRMVAGMYYGGLAQRRRGALLLGTPCRARILIVTRGICHVEWYEEIRCCNGRRRQPTAGICARRRLPRPPSAWRRRHKRQTGMRAMTGTQVAENQRRDNGALRRGSSGDRRRR